MSLNKETLYSNHHATVNNKQIDLLKKHFPQCFDKSGNFIQEKMLEIVNENDIDLSKESYSLNWLGKSYARLLTNLPPETLLTEDKNHNQLDENKDSKNLLIKGDNLEVLKHLVNAYSEKVKMIYIDPPYNTGSDGFIYNDDRKFTKEQLSELAAIDIDEAERILEFTTSKSNSHSAWLTFMYPRLYVARELLKDDGVIFISIDDNEASQLKVLCDEIFGELNFCSTFIIKSNPRGSQSNGFSANQHEYVICYAKNISVLKPFNVPLNKNMESEYNLEDIHGVYRLLGLRLRGGSWRREQRPLLYYPVFIKQNGEISLNDNGGEAIYPIKPSTGEDGTWRWSKDKFKKDKHLIKVKKVQRNGIEKWDLFTKDYLFDNESGEKKGTKPKSIFDEKEFNYQNGTNELKILFDNHPPFSFPKPTFLITKLIEMVCNFDDIVLDFFSGSGTTASAVLNYNKKVLNFINIQLPEKTNKKSEAYKVGYNTIFDITKARIKNSVKKIKIENPDYQGDLGFKIFETVEDFRRDNTALTLENLNFFDGDLLTYKQYQSLLITWSLYDGNLLTDNIINIKLNNYQCYYCNGCLYLLAPGFSNKALKALLLKLDNDVAFIPHKVVMYGDNFGSTKQRELNEALKSYSNKKSLDLNIVVRN